MGKGGAAISDYILHLPEAESVTLSGPTALRLIRCGDGDAALLYIAILKNRGGGDDGKLRAQLGWDREKFRRALNVLAQQRLVAPRCSVLLEIPHFSCCISHYERPLRGQLIKIWTFRSPDLFFNFWSGPCLNPLRHLPTPHNIPASNLWGLPNYRVRRV